MEKINLNEVAQSVFAQFVEYAEDGVTIKNFDLLGYEKVVQLQVENLRKLKGDKKEADKKVASDKKVADKELGKKYFLSLRVGSEITVIIGGEKYSAKKIETKSGEYGSVACDVVGKGNRYLQFDKIVVPQGFIEKMNEKKVA